MIVSITKCNKLLLPVTCLITITLSCENNTPDKNEPDKECIEATCCNPEFNEYVEYINEVPMQLKGQTLYSSVEYPSNTDNPYKSSYLSICKKSLDKIKGLDSGNLKDDSTTMTYAYKVSGKVLSDVKNPRLVVTPVLSIYIDKIEVIKN